MRAWWRGPRWAVLCWTAGCTGPGAWEPVTFANGVPFVEAAVDDHPTSCLVDTGASGTAIRDDLGADVATLEIADVAVTTSVARLPVDHPIFAHLSDIAGAEVGCVAGADLLRDFALTIDYPRERLRLTRPRRDAWNIDDVDLGAPAFAPVGGGPIFVTDAVVAGQPSRAVVDTGATRLHLEMALFEALDPCPAATTVQVATADGTQLAWQGTVDEVTVAERTARDVPFEAYSSEQLASFNEDYAYDAQAIVGAAWLDGFAVTFNKKRREIVLQRAP